MPVPSLQSMARRRCIKHVRNIWSIGQCPIELVVSVINKIDNADQLRHLEENSPQVVGHTKEAWLNLLKRDIPEFERRLPADYKNTIFSDENADRWWRVYKKLKKEVERDTAEKDKELLQALKGIKENRGEGAKVVNKVAAASGNGVRRYQNATFNLNRDLYASKASGHADFFKKLNRNAVSKSAARMRTPMHKLKPPLSKEVKRAPLGLVEDLRERREREEESRQVKIAAANVSSTRSERIRAPRRAGGSAAPPLHAPDGQGYNLTKDREARLRRLMGGGPTNTVRQDSPPTREAIARLTEDFLEDDDDDDDGRRDDDDDDELFGLSEPPARASIPTGSARTASPLRAGTGPRAGPTMLKKNKDPPTLFRPSVRR